MAIPRFFVRIPAGTDTRNQFTTPPDARQVEDLMTALEDPVVGGTISGSFNHTSTGNWVRCDFGSSDKVTDDGNWNGTYDCWAPPAAYFDDWTTIYVDIPWRCEFYDPGTAYWAGVQAATRATLGAGSVSTELNGNFEYVGTTGPTYGYAITASGVIPAVPLTYGQTVELRTWQNTGGNQTITFRWGVRLHGMAA